MTLGSNLGDDVLLRFLETRAQFETAKLALPASEDVSEIGLEELLELAEKLYKEGLVVESLGLLLKFREAPKLVRDPLSVSLEAQIGAMLSCVRNYISLGYWSLASDLILEVHRIIDRDISGREKRRVVSCVESLISYGVLVSLVSDGSDEIFAWLTEPGILTIAERMDVSICEGILVLFLLKSKSVFDCGMSDKVRRLLKNCRKTSSFVSIAENLFVKFDFASLLHEHGPSSVLVSESFDKKWIVSKLKDRVNERLEAFRTKLSTIS